MEPFTDKNLCLWKRKVFGLTQTIMIFGILEFISPISSAEDRNSFLADDTASNIDLGEQTASLVANDNMGMTSHNYNANDMSKPSNFNSQISQSESVGYSFTYTNSSISTNTQHSKRYIKMCSLETPILVNIK